MIGARRAISRIRRAMPRTKGVLRSNEKDNTDHPIDRLLDNYTTKFDILRRNLPAMLIKLELKILKIG